MHQDSNYDWLTNEIQSLAGTLGHSGPLFYLLLQSLIIPLYGPDHQPGNSRTNFLMILIFFRRFFKFDWEFRFKFDKRATTDCWWRNEPNLIGDFTWSCVAVLKPPFLLLRSMAYSYISKESSPHASTEPGLFQLRIFFIMADSEHLVSLRNDCKFYCITRRRVNDNQSFNWEFLEVTQSGILKPESSLSKGPMLVPRMYDQWY